MTTFTESVVEQAALGWLEGIGWPVRNGTDLAPDGPVPERRDYSQVVLETRLRDALCPGSYVAISHSTADTHTEEARAVEQVTGQTATPVTLRRRDEVARFFTEIGRASCRERVLRLV